jgi:hypothetical protein
VRFAVGATNGVPSIPVPAAPARGVVLTVTAPVRCFTHGPPLIHVRAARTPTGLERCGDRAQGGVAPRSGAVLRRNGTIIRIGTESYRLADIRAEQHVAG